MARDWLKIDGYLSIVQILISTTVFILAFGSDVSLGMTAGAGIASGAALGIAAGFEDEGKRESLVLHAVMSGLFGAACFVPIGQTLVTPVIDSMQRATVGLLFVTAFLSLGLTVMSGVLAYRYKPSMAQGEKKPLLSSIQA